MNWGAVHRRPANVPKPAAQDLRPPKSAADPSDRLVSWKEIAAYLKREARTVQRWEKREGLPVYRHQHDERATVYAYKAELDAWWHNRQPALEIPANTTWAGKAKLFAMKGTELVAVHSWPRWWLWVAGVVAFVVAAAVLIYVLESRRSRQMSFEPRRSVLIASFESRTGDPAARRPLEQAPATPVPQPRNWKNRLPQSPRLPRLPLPRLTRDAGVVLKQQVTTAIHALYLQRQYRIPMA